MEDEQYELQTTYEIFAMTIRHSVIELVKPIETYYGRDSEIFDRYETKEEAEAAIFKKSKGYGKYIILPVIEKRIII